MPASTTRVRYKPILLVSLYRYAKAGMTNRAIAEALEIGASTLDYWVRKRGEVREALRMGRQEVPDEDSFRKFFYDRLAPDLQALWVQVLNAEGGMAQLNGILSDHGVRARQSLFLHAMIHFLFDPTRAMQCVGIDRRTINRWIDTDPEFAEMMQEVEMLKGEYFEKGLIALVEQKDRGAILFANSRYNRKRGYGTAQDVNVNVSGNINLSNTLDLSELDLSQACRVEIAEAIRKLDQQREETRLLGTGLPEERYMRKIEQAIVDSVPESQDSK